MKGIILFLFYISSALKAVTVTAQPQSRHLPEKVLVAYTTNKCHDLDQMRNVTKAIEDGVNVLIWGFHSFFADETTKLGLASDLNVEKFIAYKKSLQQMGHGNVLHLVSFGGWDGKHLPSGVTSDELRDTFQAYNTQQNTLENETLFDGIDWDLEGHDNITSPLNEFTVECLNQIGELSQKVKEDGLIVSMAPPESYLDITNVKFSRFVNLTYPEPWQKDFQYHGCNVYAYILAKWNDVIDLIFVQFYESYSHAAYRVSVVDMNPSEFLIAFNHRLVAQGEGLSVRFESDPSVALNNQFVSLPLSKLVFGFANGWALNDGNGDGKVVFFERDAVNQAYESLKNDKMEPRGFGFWVVEEEGKNKIYYANDLGQILGLQKRNVFLESS